MRFAVVRPNPDRVLGSSHALAGDHAIRTGPQTARVTKRLTVLAVSRESSAGMHADGNGLYLHVKDSGAKSWTLIFKLNRKRREMGLGPYPAISLALAREQAGSANTEVASGIDPIAARKKSAASTVAVTFGDAATNLIAALKGGWKNPKHHQQWTNTLTTHAASLWNRPIDQIEAQHVLDVLTPIWAEIPETASRVRGRIERALGTTRLRSQSAAFYDPYCCAYERDAECGLGRVRL